MSIFTPLSNNQLAGNSYDAAGNQTNDGLHTYTFSAENQILSMDAGAATYAYDGYGKRMKKTVGSETTYTFYGPGGIISEFTTSNAIATATAASSTDKCFYQTSDKLGSAVLVMNSSGVVTMIINQQVSAPEPPPLGVTSASTSFSNRSISTQLTVEDGDTVAIAGIITEKRTESSGGVPVLHRIPVLGAAFGAKSSNSSRTELIIFLTPRVIYDTNQIIDATDELKSNLKRVQKLMKE